MGIIKRFEGKPETPLGTAEWYRGGGAVRRFQRGDFWLGHLDSGEPIGFRDDRHAFIDGGTRGGKGISIIIPNLLLWEGSTFNVDPKGENAMVTARARGNGSRYCHGRGQPVWICDPCNAVSTPEDDFADLKACFNPLDLIDASREESMEEAGRIADAIIVSELSKDPFFDESAKDLLKALILHVVSWKDFSPHERNLNTVRELITGGDRKARKLAELSGKKAPSGYAFLFEAMRRNPAFGGTVANFGEMFATLERNGGRTFANILQVASTNTGFLESPGMKRCLAKSDFKLSELKTNPKGMSLYLCLEDGKMETHFRWLRMMITLTITEMERIKQQPASNHPVMMVLDEFPALRRMRVIENAAAQIAGYGVKLVFVVQTLPQLKDLYKDNWETLAANAGVKLFFCNDDHFSRQYVSNLIGECEVVRTVRTVSETNGTSTSKSESRSSSVSVGESWSTSTSFSSSNRPGTVSVSTTRGGSTNVSNSQSNSTTHGQSYSATNGHSETIQKRPLVTPDEVGRLFGDRDRPTALALISGYQPIFLNRIFYFKELWLAGYYDLHPHHPAPLTIGQADAKRAQVKREKEMAAAKAKAEREARERLEAYCRYWQQESERLHRLERDKERQALLDKHEREREAERARAAWRWTMIKKACFWTPWLGGGAVITYALGILVWRVLFLDRRHWPWWAENLSITIERLMQ